MNVHTCLVKQPLPPTHSHIWKSSSHSHFADSLWVFAAVFMEVPQGLIRRNGMGFSQPQHTLACSPHNSQPERGERFKITRLTSPELQTNSHCSGSAASSRKVTSLFENVFKDPNHKVNPHLWLCEAISKENNLSCWPQLLGNSADFIIISWQRKLVVVEQILVGVG